MKRGGRGKPRDISLNTNETKKLLKFFKTVHENESNEEEKTLRPEGDESSENTGIDLDSIYTRSHESFSSKYAHKKKQPTRLQSSCSFSFPKSSTDSAVTQQQRQRQSLSSSASPPSSSSGLERKRSTSTSSIPSETTPALSSSSSLKLLLDQKSQVVDERSSITLESLSSSSAASSLAAKSATFRAGLNKQFMDRKLHRSSSSHRHDHSTDVHSKYGRHYRSASKSNTDECDDRDRQNSHNTGAQNRRPGRRPTSAIVIPNSPKRQDKPMSSDTWRDGSNAHDRRKFKHNRGEGNTNASSNHPRNTSHSHSAHNYNNSNSSHSKHSKPSHYDQDRSSDEEKKEKPRWNFFGEPLDPHTHTDAGDDDTGRKHHTDANHNHSHGHSDACNKHNNTSGVSSTNHRERVTNVRPHTANIYSRVPVTSQAPYYVEASLRQPASLYHKMKRSNYRKSNNPNSLQTRFLQTSKSTSSLSISPAAAAIATSLSSSSSSSSLSPSSSLLSTHSSKQGSLSTLSAMLSSVASSGTTSKQVVIELAFKMKAAAERGLQSNRMLKQRNESLLSRMQSIAEKEQGKMRKLQRENEELTRSLRRALLANRDTQKDEEMNELRAQLRRAQAQHAHAEKQLEIELANREYELEERQISNADANSASSGLSSKQEMRLEMLEHENKDLKQQVERQSTRVMVIRAETAAEYEEQLNQAWQDHANCHLTKEKYARLKRQHDNCFPAIRDLENKLKREQGWRMAAESEKTEFEEKYKEMKQLHDTCPRTIQMIKDQCNSKIKEFPEVQFQLQMLRLEHSKCNGVIASLRTQLEKVTHQECEKKFREYEERIKEAVQTHSKCDDLFLRYEQKLEKAKTIEVVEKEKTKRLARARRLVSTMLPTLGLVFISGPPQGVLVAEVKVNSAADFANIKVKDVICQVKGHNTKTKEDFFYVLNVLEAGEKVPVLLLRSDEYMTVVLTLGAQGFRREEVRVLRRLSERNDDDFECALLDEARNAPLTADSPWKRYRYLAMDNERNFEANPVPQVLPLVAVMKKADQEKELKRLQTLVSTLELKLLEVDHITYALEKIVGRQKGWTLNKPQVKQIKDLMKVMKQAEKAEKAAAASANPPSHAAKTRKFRSRRKHENR